MVSLGIMEVVPQIEVEDTREERMSGGNLSVSSSGGKIGAARTPTTEKKQRSWYYASMYPSYKTRKGEFRDQFPECNKCKFVVDYSCAYHKDILHQGRMFVSNTACCFYSYIFGWEQRLILDWRDVTAITKEKTAIFIPNAVQIVTKENKFFFASFVDRDSSFMMMLKFWQAATTEQLISDEDIDQIIALNYGEGDDDSEQLAEPEEVTDYQVPPEAWGEEVAVVEREELDIEVQTVLNTWMSDTGGSIVCDKTFSRPLQEVYNLLYTNSNFFFTFHKDRGSTELEMGDWEEQEEQGGVRLREVSYNMCLSNPVGPKKCQVKETQKMSMDSVIEDQIYCIETEAENSGVPYADSFTVITNSCLVSLGPGKARFIAKAEITFKKDLWSFLKDKIEANAWSGITSYYAQLAASLESYSASLPEHAQSSKSRRQSRLADREEEVQQAGWPRSQDILLYLLVLLLLITSGLNTVALCRISSLVDMSVTSPPLPEPFPPPVDYTAPPKNQADWIELLERQAHFYSQRSSWLRERLMMATSHLGQAEVELGRLRVELEGMEAGDWMQKLETELVKEETDCDKDDELDSCDKDEQTMHVGLH